MVERFAADLADAVDYAAPARRSRPRPARSTAAWPAGFTAEADEFIRAVMADMMDEQQGVPLPG